MPRLCVSPVDYSANSSPLPSLGLNIEYLDIEIIEFLAYDFECYH
jgi:hypothetical protein